MSRVHLFDPGSGERTSEGSERSEPSGVSEPAAPAR
jgi:hypothetical protein